MNTSWAYFDTEVQIYTKDYYTYTYYMISFDHCERNPIFYRGGKFTINKELSQNKETLYNICKFKILFDLKNNYNNNDEMIKLYNAYMTDNPFYFGDLCREFNIEGYLYEKEDPHNMSMPEMFILDNEEIDLFRLKNLLKDNEYFQRQLKMIKER